MGTITVAADLPLFRCHRFVVSVHAQMIEWPRDKLYTVPNPLAHTGSLRPPLTPAISFIRVLSDLKQAQPIRYIYIYI